VSDAEIEAALRTMQSSEQVCRDLVALTLDRGATDNVTVIAGRAVGAE
jgi:serine/threonine protein phosphatase PrpC